MRAATAAATQAASQAGRWPEYGLPYSVGSSAVSKILHAERDAMEHAAHRARVERSCLASRELRVERRPGVDLAVARFDPGEAILDHLQRAQLTLRESQRQLARPHLVRVHHGSEDNCPRMAVAKASLLFAVLLAWQLAALRGLPQYVLSPLEIVSHFVQALGSAELYEHIG